MSAPGGLLSQGEDRRLRQGVAGFIEYAPRDHARPHHGDVDEGLALCRDGHQLSGKVGMHLAVLGVEKCTGLRRDDDVSTGRKIVDFEAAHEVGRCVAW